MTRVRRTYSQILQDKKRELEELEERVREMQERKSDPVAAKKRKAVYALRAYAKQLKKSGDSRLEAVEVALEVVSGEPR